MPISIRNSPRSIVLKAHNHEAIESLGQLIDRLQQKSITDPAKEITSDQYQGKISIQTAASH
jgi:hypothetical protein